MSPDLKRFQRRVESARARGCRSRRVPARQAGGELDPQHIKHAHATPRSTFRPLNHSRIRFQLAKVWPHLLLLLAIDLNGCLTGIRTRRRRHRVGPVNWLLVRDVVL
jgi:hypothetical protein